MSGLLPTRSDATVDQRDDPAVLCLDDERTSTVLERVSSETAQAVLRELNEQPMTATDLADQLEMSIQRVRYHLENLSEVGLIEVIDTCYSEKGREMDVYGPASEPILVFLGSADDRPGLQAAFKNLASAVGPIAIVLALGESIARLFQFGEQ